MEHPFGSVESRCVAIAMMNLGGGFIGRLGSALFYADEGHARKLKEAFPGHWNHYLQLAIDMNLHEPDAYESYLAKGLKRIKSGRF